MTVSETAETNHKLPSVSSLVSSTYNFLATPPNASVLLGFAGWLFVPILISLGGSFLEPDINKYVHLLANILLFGLSLWATCAIIISVTSLIRPDLAPKDAVTSVSELAWRRAITLLWIGLLSGVLQILGLFLFIIPGIVIMVWFAFAEIEAVLNGSGTLLALKQSRARVRGYFFPVLWRLAAFGLLLVTGVTLLLWPILSAKGLTDPMVIIYATPAWLNALLSMLEVLLLPIILTYELHLYFSLRKS